MAPARTMVSIAHSSQIPIVTKVVPEEWPKGCASQIRVQLTGNGLGNIIHVPVIVVRGAKQGPTVGITAVVHGDELNGMRIIHRILAELDAKSVHGTIVAVPVVNVPGYHLGQREFLDNRDLNRIMPGDPSGCPSDVYAYRFLERVVSSFDYLIDLHTASAGRNNSFYIRADLRHPVAARMASVQFPEIVLHNEAIDGTLRNAAMERGIPSITVEVGNPRRFQDHMVSLGLDGVLNTLCVLDVLKIEPVRPKRRPIVCMSSAWVYTTAGGVLNVLPNLRDRVQSGELVAQIVDVWGNHIEDCVAPFSGVVIGKSVNPVSPTGSRVVHLGRIATSKDIRTMYPAFAHTRGWRAAAQLDG